MGFASVGYSLAGPERSISHAVQDAVNAVEVGEEGQRATLLQFLINRYPEVDEFIVGGHSAGAHLAFQGICPTFNERTV